MALPDQHRAGWEKEDKDWFIQSDASMYENNEDWFI